MSEPNPTRDAAAEAYDLIGTKMKSEPNAYKRAVFRAGWDAALASRAPAPETAGLVELLGNAAAYLNADHAIGHAADVLRAADALTAMQARLDDVTAERDMLVTMRDLYSRRKLEAERDALQEQLAQARAKGMAEVANEMERQGWDAGSSEIRLIDGMIRALTPSPTRSTEDGA